MDEKIVKKTILAVDDMPANIDVIKGILSPEVCCPGRDKRHHGLENH